MNDELRKAAELALEALEMLRDGPDNWVAEADDAILALWRVLKNEAH